MSTESADYAERLRKKQTVWWKRALHVQAPYHWNLRRQGLGRTLDVGCGIGRNLAVLPAGSVGVDHNSESVAIARSMGYDAVTSKEFLGSTPPASFDGILLAHVIEHMDADSGEKLLREYLKFLKPGGKVFFVCPQERGYDSDPTHERFTTGDDLVELCRTVGLVPQVPFSFPFPRKLGKIFIYNEFCLLARRPA
ncbi:class I SAM-dependent methyltransferase [Antrihabitans cavernicola]|uniref:Class I SAM-dependent methyltransferase n=1 Tax=Antrihabitans cavernicola TaxID=2495913 RepID=A0A5A7SI20_9NOCA|nr:class I SAM-dependent methyltransferase [Spelaeibacter cavernicola]KAA0024822.1 class I SAM-dependent methyltransferase [Spelaeibacter cavernicola]